jgi:2-polyprenyl-3-methyl-5-hydroxy-6-metoxy-1,4-benzoquinol methylase
MEHSSTKKKLYRKYQSGLNGASQRGRLPHLVSFVRKHFPPDRSARILDIGCGTGALLQVLSDFGYEDIIGVDDSPSQVETATTRFVRRGDGLDFLQRQPTESVDVIVTFDVIEHLTREALLALGHEIHRVLHPGGAWIIHAPNAAGIFGARVRYADLTHELAFTVDSVSQLATLLEFSDVKCFEDKPTIHGIKSFVRYCVWQLLRIPMVAIWLVETGSIGSVILSQNLTAVLRK